jgi:hypothetical protein
VDYEQANKIIEILDTHTKLLEGILAVFSKYDEEFQLQGPDPNYLQALKEDGFNPPKG